MSRLQAVVWPLAGKNRQQLPIPQVERMAITHRIFSDFFPLIYCTKSTTVRNTLRQTTQVDLLQLQGRKHLLLRVNEALHLVVWVSHYRHGIIIYFTKNPLQKPVLSNVRDLLGRYNRSQVFS